MEPKTKSWKTTIAGVLMILIAVFTVVKSLLNGAPIMSINFETVLTEVVGGVGLIMAKDYNVSGFLAMLKGEAKPTDPPK